MRRINLKSEQTHSWQHPHIRILGADCTGKSALCEAITLLMPNFIAFAGTDSYVYDWLRAHNIGTSSTVTPEQVETRKNIFLAANRVQMRAVAEIIPQHPVVAVRGRADTIITHAVLQDQHPSHSGRRLFPIPYMRPDMLVVLTTPIPRIAARLAMRGQAATGANSLEFHGACQAEYREVGNAVDGIPVLEFDTSDPRLTPKSIADQVLGGLNLG